MSEEIKEKRVKKPKSKIRSIIEWVFTGIFATIFVFLAIAQIDGMVHKGENNDQMIRFGTGSFLVLSDSMAPLYNKDDAIISYKENMDNVVEKFNKGEDVDIVFFNSGLKKDVTLAHKEYNTQIATGEVMTHRVTEVYTYPDVEYGKGRYLFVTAGINDQGLYSRKGQYQLVDETLYLGTVVHSSTALGGFFRFISSVWGLLIFLLVPAGYLVVTSSIDILKAMKESENQPPVDASNIDISTLSKKDQERLKKELIEEMLKKQQEGGNSNGESKE